MNKEMIRNKEAKKVTLIGFFINGLLTAFKLFAGITGKSNAMLADAVHSLSDFLTDIVVLVGFKLTSKPEDETHNYGHDKYETLSSAIISIFLAFAGFRILITGYNNLVLYFNGELTSKPGIIAIIAAGFSIIVKELLYRYTMKKGIELKSNAIKANAWHHRSDAYSSIGTLIGIWGAAFLGSKWLFLDPLASIVVSLLIFKVSIEIFIPSVNELLEISLDKEDVEEIRSIILTTNEVKDFHDLRTRRIGKKAAVEFHLLLDQDMSLVKSHDIATDIENKILELFDSECIITIHVEPYEE
jgi:cation diffusion facilitator family transporter